MTRKWPALGHQPVNVKIISSWDSAPGHIVSARTGHTSPGSQLLSSVLSSPPSPSFHTLEMVSFSLTYFAQPCRNWPEWTSLKRNWKKLISTIMHDVSACVVSFISRLLFSLSSSFCPYRQHSRVCILRGVRYCKCRLLVMLWGPCLDYRVWSGHKKIIVSDPDIYGHGQTRCLLMQRSPSSADVTLATSFYHQPVFMFMGNFQILPQITVWRVPL